MTHEIQDASESCRHAAAWRTINRLTGRKAKASTVVAANSISHRKELMAQHYSNILNAPPPQETLPPPPGLTVPALAAFNCGPITQEEVAKALNATRPDTASGPDDIPARVLKLPALLSTITRLLNASCALGGDLRPEYPPSGEQQT